MPSFFSTAFAAGLVSMAAAAAIPAKNSTFQTPPKPVVGATFSVEQVSIGQTALPPPAVAMLNTYAKFKKTAKAPKHLKAAATAQADAQEGSVEAIPTAYDEEYLTPVTVGGQTLNLDFDTGSSDLWVYSSLMSEDDQEGHEVYEINPENVMEGYSWQIGYGDGSGASGTVYSDRVQVGGVTATSMAVEAATSVSSAFLSDTNNDGLLGLAFDNVNQVSPKQVPTFFDSVKSTLQSSLFTVTLKKGAPGTFDFGYIDETKYTGDITYVPVQSQSGFWMFNAGAYKVGNNAPAAQHIGKAIADTGTSLLYLPKKIVKNYYSKIPGSQNNAQVGGWIFPCDSAMPDLTVMIGGNPFVVPGSLLNYAPVSNTLCFGGVQPNIGMGFSIFGDVFLKSVFAVFDQTEASPRLGFAAQA